MDHLTMTTEAIEVEWNTLGCAGLSLTDRALALEGEMRRRCGVLEAAHAVLTDKEKCLLEGEPSREASGGGRRRQAR